MSTTFMLLDLPTVSVTVGPTWATNVNTAFGVIDSHDHTTGKGVAVPTAGININSNLPFNSFKATTIKAVNMTAETATTSDLRSLYSVNGNLYYNNTSGVAIQLTSGSGINIASTGTIGGDYGQAGISASAIYTDSIKTFTWTQSANKPAKMAMGDIILGETIVSPNTITIKSPTSLGSSYNFILPTALPASQKFLTLDSSGNTALGDTDASTLANTAGVLSVKDVGVTQAKLFIPTVSSSEAGTCTMTIASPCVVTKAGHGYSANDLIAFCTTGALPTGITQYTFYYVKAIDANTFNISATSGGANINTSGSQSGTQSVQKVVTNGNPFISARYTNTTTTTALAEIVTFRGSIRTTGRPVIFRIGQSPGGGVDTMGCNSVNNTSPVQYGMDYRILRNGTTICIGQILGVKPTTAAAFTGSTYIPTNIYFEDFVAAGDYVYQLQYSMTGGNTANGDLYGRSSIREL